MRQHGSSKAEVIHYLEKLKAQLELEEALQSQCLLVDRMINHYIDVYEYSMLTPSVLQNLKKRFKKLSPILLKALASVESAEDEKAIRALLENYNSIQEPVSTSLLGSLQHSWKKAWKAPPDVEENKN